MCHFQHDPRPMLASRIQTLDFTKCNYNDMYRAIHELSVVSLLPVQHVKSLTQNSKKKRPKSNDICRNFQKGTCKFPECIYKHVLLDATATKTPPVVPPKDPKSQALPSKTRYPTHITSEHRRQIGTPSGVVTAANPTVSSFLPSGSLAALILTPDMRATPGNPAQLDMPPVPLVALTTLAFSCSVAHRHHPHPQL